MQKFQNSFLFEDNSIVTGIESREAFLYVELEDTIFYPGGGGQPCDYGVIKSDSFFGEVIEVTKAEGRILHKVRSKHGELHLNDAVEMKVDKERRLRLIKMHTGEHILFKCLQTITGEISLNKINLDEIESSLFINAQNLDWDMLFRSEEMANKIIDEDRKIIEKEYPKTDAVMMDKVRIKPDRIKSDTVRVLEIDGFDWSACTGTHAHSTGFVGNLLITRFNFVKGSWEIRFRTDSKKELFDLAKIARSSASLFQADVNNVTVFIRKLQEESESYKEKYRRLSFELLDNFKSEKIGKFTFIYNSVEDMEKKQLVDKAASLAVDDKIIFFMNRSGGNAAVLLSISPALKLNAPEILNKALAKFNGKGGGRDNFAMGSIEEKFSAEFIDELRSILITY